MMNAYRTVSITPCVGTRFEYITSQRLLSLLTVKMFDTNQFG